MVKEIVMIRQAGKAEYQELTSISFASKRYWNYPDVFFDVWSKELTISQKYIEDNNVFVYEVNEEIAGYYSVVKMLKDIELSGIVIHKGYWLEHMFLSPQYIGRGIGRKMFDHLKQWCQLEGIFELNILSDPNAKGFYEKMGCEYQKEFPSTIPNRTTPWLIYTKFNKS